MKRVSIIGVGNYNSGDDSIGLLAIEALQEKIATNRDSHTLKKEEEISIRLYIANQDPFLVGSIIAGGEKAIIVDAADMNAPIGTIKSFSLEEAIPKLSHKSTSTHGFDLGEILNLVKSMGYSANVRILGIQIDKNNLQGPKNSFQNELKEKVISKILEEVEQIA